MKKHIIVLSFLIGASTLAFALEEACKPILDAVTQRAAKASWRSMTHSAVGETEYIKAGTQFFQYSDTSGWEEASDMDQAEQAKLKNILNGNFKITDCKDAGVQSIRGTVTRMTQYLIDMPGFAASPVTLYTGRQDGLPYRQTYRDTVTDYYYDRISVPRLP